MLGESMLVGIFVFGLYLMGYRAEAMLGLGAAAWVVLAYFARRAKKVKERAT